MRNLAPKYQKKQGSFSKMALLLIVLLLIFWKDKLKAWFCPPCECDNTQKENQEENPVFTPGFNPAIQQKEMEVSKELYERENDSNVLDLSKNEIVQQFFPETDTLRLTSVFNR